MRRLRALTSHVAQALTEAGLIALVAVILVAGTAFAGKPSTGGGGGGGGHKGGGSTGGSGSFTIVLAVDNNGNGAFNWNDSVTYTVNSASTAYPYVSTQCKQSNTLVLSTSAGFFPSYAWPSAQVVPLQTDVWTSGAASCTARLYSMDGGSQSILSTQTFSVGG